MESSKSAAGRGAQDAIAMLKADHERVRQLCEQYGKAAGARTPDEDRKRRLAERLCQEIDVHAQVEEELFYPAVRASIPNEGLMDEAQVEHQSAKELIRQIRGASPSDDLYDARVKVLGEYVRHHVQEEESQMFPKAKRAKVDMADLGRRMAERRQQLEAEHAMAPFDTIASMLMVPIRAAARAGAALGTAATRASGTKRAATGTRAAASTATRVTATRVAGAGTRAAAAATRTATGAGRGGSTSGGRASAASGTGRARAGAASGGGRAAASVGRKRGASKGGKAAAGARRSRATR